MAMQAPEGRGKKPAGLYRTLWHYAAGDQRRVVLFMALLIVAQALKLAIPYLSGAAVEAMQAKGNEALGAAAWDMALIFLACVASWALHGPARVLERFVAIRIRERFADTLYAKATSLPLDWHEHHHSGETIERVQKSGSALFGFAQNQFVYLQNTVSLVGPIAAIFVLSVPTGVAALASYALIALMLVRFDRVMIRLNHAQNQAQARYAATLVDCLGNIATVLTLRLAGPTRRLVAARLGAVFAPLRSSIVLNEAKWCAVDLLSNMAGNYQDLVGYQTDLRCTDVITAAAARLPCGDAAPAAWREIRIEKLDFAYLGKRRGQAALRDVSLTLRRGDRIALVGESGSGKSTLLRVLAGLYRADGASFVIDGKNRPAVADLGAIATLAPQDPEIFAGSIAHNLTFGIEHDPAAIRHACELAMFTPVVESLPGGLDTEIAERGLNLSGGQKQRLAVARAILAAQHSSLILLDEPTSSLDPATEAEVYANLFAALRDACVVSSLHRLHLLERFDRVVLMADGRILDVGAAAELLEREPHFRELWRRYGGGAPPEQRRRNEPAGMPWRVHAARG